VKLKHWVETSAWEDVIVGFDDCSGTDRKVATYTSYYYTEAQ